MDHVERRLREEELISALSIASKIIVDSVDVFSALHLFLIQQTAQE